MSRHSPNTGPFCEVAGLARYHEHAWWWRATFDTVYRLLLAWTHVDKRLTACRKISEKYDKPFAVGCLEPQTNGPRANAAIVVLARNKELDGVIQSIKSFERHFNRWFNYPYVFLNDGDFNTTFKETVGNHTKSTVEWGKISPEHWGFPDWADPAVVKEGIAKQGDRAIMYGGMESYHHMCRFYSGYMTLVPNA